MEDGRRNEDDNDEVVAEEYVVEDLRDHDHGKLSKRRSRFTLLAGDLGLDPSRRSFNKEKFIDGIRGCSNGFFIHPQNRLLLSLSLSNRHILVYFLSLYYL